MIPEVKVVAGATESPVEEIKERKKRRTQEEKEEDKRHYKSRHKYWNYVKKHTAICNKAIEERNKHINSNWKSIQELLSSGFYLHLKGIRTKVDFCQIIDKRTNEIYTEGAINQVLKLLLNLMYEVLRDAKDCYPI